MSLKRTHCCEPGSVDEPNLTVVVRRLPADVWSGPARGVHFMSNNQGVFL